jgi:2,3-diketo-5-methylthio-1-phosphopentane phosphatase
VESESLGVLPREVGDLTAPLAPHSSSTHTLAAARELAVFCDFDGTFLVQDVGSTLAKAHIPERREQLWDRYESGELTAWEYTVELLDGFALPEATLDAFLETVRLDPGSKELLRWCKDSGVPFEILSDGFDRNLRALQRLNDVEFGYRANRLRYVNGCWSIGPGHPNETCGCGTGTCKGTIISEYRAEHPNALCVHIGNGRVSDLCGARSADLSFAKRGQKDTLGPALEECGEAFTYFDSLNDVVTCLEAVRSGKPLPRP